MRGQTKNGDGKKETGKGGEKKCRKRERLRKEAHDDEEDAVYMLYVLYVCLYVRTHAYMDRFIHSFILAISIAPLQVHCYSEALPTTARVLYRSFTPKLTGNCTCK